MPIQPNTSLLVAFPIIFLLALTVRDEKLIGLEEPSNSARLKAGPLCQSKTGLPAATPISSFLRQSSTVAGVDYGVNWVLPTKSLVSCFSHKVALGITDLRDRSISIPKGFVVIPVRLVPQHMCGGYLLPGTYLDLISVSRLENGEEKVKTIAEKVMFVNDVTDLVSSRVKAIGLFAVPSTQAVRIFLGQFLFDIDIRLPKYGDEGPAPAARLSGHAALAKRSTASRTSVESR
jgi:hypothetical protein